MLLQYFTALQPFDLGTSALFYEKCAVTFMQAFSKTFCDSVGIVTCGLKVAGCASAGHSFAGRFPMVTRNTPLLWVLIQLLETYPWYRRSKRTVTTDMTNETLQGGDSYPSCPAGIKG
jgi:hypothetical protein